MRELVPAAKRAAVHEIERRGTGATRAVQVIDAQYGGLLPDTASVLVVCRSWRLRDGSVSPGGATYDVRLTPVARAAGASRRCTPHAPGPRDDR